MAVNQFTRGVKTKLTANFVSTEFDCKGTRNGCDVTLLNSKLYRKLQVLRNRIGMPIIINSGFRCAAHNAAVGGTRNSYHTKGYAADIRCSLSPAELAAAAQKTGFSGIGLYNGSAGHFVHVDVREQPYFWQNTAGANVTVKNHGAQRAKCPYDLPSSAVRRGSSGNGVRAVQWVLNWAGYPCRVDGIFGALTDNALRQFQRDMCLADDAVAGKLTIAALAEVSL